jgi:hypothetical protein
MQKLRPDHAFNTANRALRFTRLRLAARPDSKHLADDAQAARDLLRTRHEAWQEAKEARVAATAEINYCDEVLDAAVMDASRHALAHTQNRRDSPLYKSLFLQNPSEATRPVAGDQQRRFVHNLIQGLRALPDASPLATLAGPLAKAQEALQAAVDARDALISAEAVALTAYRIALDEAKRTYNALYHRLVLLWPDRLRLAESCFLKLKKAPSSKRARNERDDDDDPEGDDPEGDDGLTL